MNTSGYTLVPFSAGRGAHSYPALGCMLRYSVPLQSPALPGTGTSGTLPPYHRASTADGPP